MKSGADSKCSVTLLTCVVVIWCFFLVIPLLAEGHGSGGGANASLTLVSSVPFDGQKGVALNAGGTVTTPALDEPQAEEPAAATKTAAENQVRSNAYATLAGFILAGIPVYWLWRSNHKNK